MIPSNRTLWLILFSIAMGFLEATVVIYLREIYYPQGFTFPLTIMDPKLAIIELFREAATVVMLIGVGVLTGSNVNQRLAYFLSAFAIWDLFYYVFLKLALGWPMSWFTWDILFLIPVPWVGPVLAPCIASLTMIVLALALYHRDNLNPMNRLKMTEWLLIATGCIVIVGTWMSDYFSVVSGRSLTPEESVQVFSNYIPQSFHWGIFSLGEGLLLAAIARFWWRTRPGQSFRERQAE
jgi:hypothetical protein